MIHVGYIFGDVHVPMSQPESPVCSHPSLLVPNGISTCT